MTGSRGGRMGRWRVRAVCTALILVLPAAAGSSVRSAANPGIARARFLMGTRLSIETSGPVAPEVLEEAFDEVSRLEAALSNWRSTSEIVRLNRQAARRPVRCSDDLYDAIRSSLRWAEITGGAFDPTIEPLTERFGLRRAADGLPEMEEAAPAADARSSGVGSPDGPPPVGWRHVHLSRLRRSVRFDAPGVGIDLGGIGKGIALDAAARVLRRRGVRSALLDFGGQVLAMGRPDDAPGWEVGIADPADRDEAVASALIADESVSTSSNSERSVPGERGAIGHIFDPSRGEPARFEGSVTVAAPDGTSADALSTALFVMGPGPGVDWAEGHDVAVLFLWRDSAGILHRRATSGFSGKFDRDSAREDE